MESYVQQELFRKEPQVSSTPSSVMWNLWHGCKKYSEGCENCYMYYLDEVRGVPERACEVKKTGDFNKPLQKTGRVNTRYRQSTRA